MPDRSAPPPNPNLDTLFSEMRQRARDVFAHALAQCSIPLAFARNIRCEDGSVQIGDERYELASFRRVAVISIGKAGHTMAQTLAAILDRDLSGIVACPTDPPGPVRGFRYFLGGHPLPNHESLLAGSAILNEVSHATADSLVLYLISGGASAIAEKPIHDDLTLSDVVETNKALVHSGAPIAEINAIRKHLSAIKGGRLAQAAAPARQCSVLVSDVPDHALDALASGPTMPDSTTTVACYALADRYRMLAHFPARVAALFQRRLLQETPKPGDSVFQRSQYVTVLSNQTAVEAAAQNAASEGFTVEIDNSCDDWDYATAADHLLAKLRQLRRGAPRVCVVSGGEVTVKVGDTAGKGGRNQQFALYCAQQVAGEAVTVLSAGTDGIDGNSPAAGAVVDGSSLQRAATRGFDTAGSLARFDAYPLFVALGDAIMTGPTGNNVRDLRILLAY